MVEAAVADVPGLVPGRLEIDHGGNSYTADTLEALGEQFPEAELYTIVGDDAAAGLRTWARYDEVVASSRLVVDRPPRRPVELPDDVDWIRVEVPGCRCRRPTFEHDSPMAARSTTSSPNRCST